MKPTARLFDAYGNSMPPGDFSIGVFDLRRWATCRLLTQETTPRPQPDVILLLPLIGEQLLPDPILGSLIAALDDGQTVAIHAPDDEALVVAWNAIAPLLGAAGNA
jgi:hypothetical protein